MISWRAGPLEVLELGLQLVEGLLGQPDGAGVLVMSCAPAHVVLDAGVPSARPHRVGVVLPSDAVRCAATTWPALPDGQNGQVSKSLGRRSTGRVGGQAVSAGAAGRAWCTRASPRWWRGARCGSTTSLRPSTGVKASSPTVVWSSARARTRQLASTPSVQLDVDACVDLVVARDVEGDELGLGRRGAVEPRRPGQPRRGPTTARTAATADERGTPPRCGGAVARSCVRSARSRTEA